MNKGHQTRSILLSAAVLTTSLLPGDCTAAAQTQPQAQAQAKSFPAPSNPTAPLPATPYSAAFPKPSFTTTDRKLTQFPIEYVFRYYESAYSPVAPIRTSARTATTMDSAEHTFAAAISAATALDYDWWLSLWDEKSQALNRLDATGPLKRDQASWKRQAQRFFQGREVSLVKRLEVGTYVILEYRVGPVPSPGQPEVLAPMIFKPEGGKWVLTRALDDSGFFPAALFGSLMQSTNLSFAPVPSYGGETTPFTEPQQLFFQNEPRGAQSATHMVW